MTGPDERNLVGILGSAGKSIASMPEGRRVVDAVRRADTQEDLLVVLRAADLGLEEPAREVIYDAAADEARWEQVRATLLRSAELQLEERFSSNA